MSTAVPHRLADAVRARRRLLVGLGAVLLLPASSPRAQGTAACAAVQPVPEGTYVALAGDRMLRLLVESSLEKATLVLNRIEGSQLVDRRYWEPAKGTADCADLVAFMYALTDGWFDPLTGAPGYIQQSAATEAQIDAPPRPRSGR